MPTETQALRKDPSGFGLLARGGTVCRAESATGQLRLRFVRRKDKDWHGIYRTIPSGKARHHSPEKVSWHPEK